MNYKEALEYINETNKLGSVLGLQSIEKLLSLLDNPHEKLKFIHIGGTNGKGSTSNYLSNILQGGGYGVGLFTSPHINKINESIGVNGADISDEDFARILEKIKAKIQTMVEEGFNHPTTFEILTAMGFIYFSEKNVDYVILEVGLGGKNDSTNIIPPPLASVFTTIDYDHIDILGNSLEEIAYEKAGIIKRDSIVVTYPQREEVLNILKKVAKDNNSDFYLCPMENISIKEINSFGSIFDFSFNNTKIKDIKISMLGEYQVYNAALALTSVLILREKGLVQIRDEEIKAGLWNAKWPGRLEVIKRNPTILIDGAHNLQGIEQLKKALNLFEYENLILCIGILKDKEYSRMAQALAPISDKIIVTEVDSPRKLEAEKLGEEMLKYREDVYIEKDVGKSIKIALDQATKKDLIVFCGSLYLIGQIKRVFHIQYKV